MTENGTSFDQKRRIFTTFTKDFKQKEHIGGACSKLNRYLACSKVQAAPAPCQLAVRAPAGEGEEGVAG